MSLRLLEVMVPGQPLEGIRALLEEFHLVHVWASGPDEKPGLVRILLDAHDAEHLSDRLVRRFGGVEEFRLILLPVVATHPAVDREALAEAESEGAAVPRAIGPRRISREELYEDLSQASQLTSVYIVMVILSTVVAAVGLLRGDVAIIIGAMVIAPLLGPNVALALACTLGDPQMAGRSLKAIAAGVATAAALAVLLGATLGVDPIGPELMSRTSADGGDIVLALAAGAAGSLAFTTGVPAVVVGVMVAVALLPPLVASGLLAGAGYGKAALGALMLVLTNVTCVNLAAVATFLVQRVRPRTWWEAARARRATRLAVATWVLMLVALAALMLSGYVDAV